MIALVLVDLQRDYLATPELVPGADRVTARAAELLAAFRGANRPVAHVHTLVSRADDRRMAHWKSAGLWRCERGTPGALAPEAVAPRPGEPIIAKTHYDGFASGELAAWLASQGCQRLVIAGVHTHACVRATALAAYALGYQVIVADDAVGSDDPLHAEASRQWLAARSATFRPVAEIARMVKEVDDRHVVKEFDDRRVVKSLDEVTTHPVALDGVVARARAAQADWRREPVAVRAARLEALAAAIDEAREALTALIVDTIAKPETMARAEVERAADLARIAAACARAMPEREPRGPGSWVRWCPLGTIAAITPWNNPLAIAVGKLAPALAFGNAVVMKPSPHALPVALALHALVVASALPAGLSDLVIGDHDVGERLIEHLGIDAVSLTGSRRAGLAAQAICARRGLPLQAELGGNNAAIVAAGADLDDAARAIASGAFGFAGQRCTANRRVIVEAHDLDALLARLVLAMRALPCGDPRDPVTVVGPMISVAAAARVREQIAGAAADGHRVIVRETVIDLAAFVAPTLIVCADPTHPIVVDETFGPVLVVQPARDFDDALALCNGVTQGLVAALFGGDEHQRERFCDEARAGVLKLDRATSDADSHAPFGGWKTSGIGPPEHGVHDRDFYLRAQALYAPPTEGDRP